MSQVQSEILDRLRTIVRRDLKLGPDVSIADDMPFFSSDLDLDSLDILLLVTSTEKEFGIKIPSHAVGKEVFSTLSTLANYIGSHGAQSAKPVPDYLSRLPHAPPFRFITQITEVIENHSARGVWSLSGSEDFFAGHFPNRPIVPGVLIVESLAQLSGLAGPITARPQGKLVHIDIRLDKSVRPPAEIILESRLTRTVNELHQFDVRASIDSKTIAQGSLTLHRGS